MREIKQGFHFQSKRETLEAYQLSINKDLYNTKYLSYYITITYIQLFVVSSHIERCASMFQG